jgi:hypothetical protein
MLRRYEDSILNHPEIKPLVESGEWDKLTPMYQKWLSYDLVPMTKEASDYLKELIADSDARFAKIHIQNND